MQAQCLHGEKAFLKILFYFAHSLCTLPYFQSILMIPTCPLISENLAQTSAHTLLQGSYFFLFHYKS